MESCVKICDSVLTKYITSSVSPAIKTPPVARNTIEQEEFDYILGLLQFACQYDLNQTKSEAEKATRYLVRNQHRSHIDWLLCTSLICNSSSFITPGICAYFPLVRAFSCLSLIIAFRILNENTSLKFGLVLRKTTPANTFLLMLYFSMAIIFGLGPWDAFTHVCTTIAWWWALLLEKDRLWMRDQDSICTLLSLMCSYIFPIILQPEGFV